MTADANEAGSFRLRAALLAGRIVRVAHRASRRSGDGIHSRGLAIITIDPRAIETLSRGRQTALVTGTNGKTTTTYLLARALGGDVVHNFTGANMHSGIAAAYADSDARVAALEVDELHLASVATMTKPGVMVLLNLSRDQLHRSHEVARTAASWREAVGSTNALIVANCADPNIVAITPPDRAIWFDPGTRWTDDAQVCLRCGSLVHWELATWWCACGLRMPTADFRYEDRALISRDGRRHEFHLGIPGDFNYGNAVAAAVAAQAMGVDLETALGRMQGLNSAFGRFQLYDIGGRPARLVLAKNPAGMLAALDLVGDSQVILGINARDVDGRDTSWLYDVPFELLAGRQIGATGERRHDLALRLEIAGALPVVSGDIHGLAKALPAGQLCLIGNYSNFFTWRRERAWPE